MINFVQNQPGRSFTWYEADHRPGEEVGPVKVLSYKTTELTAEIRREVSAGADGFTISVPMRAIAEAAMHDHMANETEVEFIRLAGGEREAVVLGMSVNDTLVLAACAAFGRPRETASRPLGAQPCLRFVSQFAREAVVCLHRFTAGSASL